MAGRNVDWIISCRVASASYIVPGSLTASCAKCGELVLVSPSTLEIRQGSHDSQFVCMECGFAMMEKDGSEVMELTPAQVREIEEYRSQPNEKSLRR